VIEKIRAAVDAPFTVEDIESDRLALIAELASLEEEAAAERAAVETSYAEELAQVVSNLAYERERIALSQARLDALDALSRLALLMVRRAQSMQFC
jgi:hypothetical protein